MRLQRFLLRCFSTLIHFVHTSLSGETCAQGGPCAPQRPTSKMQSLVRTGPSSAIKNPFLGSTLSYRVAAAPAPTSTATRMVVTMAKKKARSSADWRRRSSCGLWLCHASDPVCCACTLRVCASL